MTNSQYERAIQIAKDNNITGDMLRRFVMFLVEWSELRGKDWTNDAGYASEWASRFKKQTEYIHASGDAIVALVHVDGAREAIRRFTEELGKYNNDVPLKDIEKDVKERLTASFNSQKQIVPQEFKGYNVAKTKPKNKCICKSAGIMIGKLPNFEKNFNKIMK